LTSCFAQQANVAPLDLFKLEKVRGHVQLVPQQIAPMASVSPGIGTQ